MAWNIRLGILFGGLLPPIAKAAQNFENLQSDPMGVVNKIQAMYTGYDMKGKQFIPSLAMQGWIPLLAGFAVSKAASKLGINKMLPKGINF